MDLTKINEILGDESRRFKESIQTAIDKAISRRTHMKSNAVEILGLDQDVVVTEKGFFTTLDSFKQISDNFGEVLKSNFDPERISAWLRGENPPKENLRGFVLRTLFEVVFDHYANHHLFHVLHRVAEEWNNDGIISVASKHDLPLETTLEELGVLEEISNLHQGVRIIKGIRNVGIVTLGELLCRSERETRQLPNFGRKSLNDLKSYLRGRFRVDFRDQKLSDKDLKRFENMAYTRQRLEQSAGKLLVSQWNGKIRPEYEKLHWQDLLKVTSEKDNEEVYEQIYADPDLMQALKETGITYRTQLATTPRQVLNSICYGRSEWEDQLKETLGGDGNLSLGMSIPLSLKTEVDVFTF